MSYIGKTPTSVPLTSSDITDSIISLPKLTDGTDGNIISYDASGNPVAVATGNDGQVLTSAGAGAPPVFETLPVGGITAADQWRVSATTTFTGSGDITANWERGDTDSQGYIGSAMTQSSGRFTFPSTGIWLVMAQMVILPDGVRTYSGGQIMVTTNNSSYNTASEVSQHTTAQDYYVSIYFHHIVDVTNTSNVKVSLKYDSNGSADVVGSTSAHATGMSFIRLGDT